MYYTEAATEFAVSLLQTLANEEPKVISELQNLVEALAKVGLYFVLNEGFISKRVFNSSSISLQLAARPGSPESLQQLVESVKNPTANAGTLPSPSGGKDDRNRQTRDKKV